jgi:hypothetical protein
MIPSYKLPPETKKPRNAGLFVERYERSSGKAKVSEEAECTSCT